MRALVSILTVFGAVLLLSGTAQAQTRTANDLKQIGLAFHNHCDAIAKAPTKGADLAPYLENNKRILDLLASGEIVFLYGVSVQDLVKSGKGLSKIVIGYEKVVPTKGGYVLFGDGSVKKMTPEEFKQAPLAKK